MKFKKILLGLLTVLLTTTIVLFGSNNVYAAAGPGQVELTKDGTTVNLNGDQITVNYVDPVLNVFGIGWNHYAFTDAKLDINKSGVIKLYKDAEMLMEAPFPELDLEFAYVNVMYHIGFEMTQSIGSFDIGISNVTLGVNGDVDEIVITFDPDGLVPVISGETTFVTNVNDEKPISFFMNYLSAYDETDGDVTSSLIVITDNYTPNKRVLGNHTFIVEASDLSGNKATATINIRVVDIDAPIITGNSSIANIGYKETWNIITFKSTLTVSDNHDTLTHNDITVKTDNYTPKKTTLGTYAVVYSVKDASGNEGTFNKQVRVMDNVKPVFSGPITISTANTTILTESDIRAQITASDEIDGNITNKITLVEDNYSGKGNKVGSYTIIYSVTDNSGNNATHTVTVQRIDSIPPIIWVVDGVSLRVTPTTPLSREQIIDILEATGQLQINATTTFTFPLDEYTGNEETPGIYAMSILSRSTNGNQNLHSFSIQVLNVETDDDLITKEESSWLEDNMLWIVIAAAGLLGGAYLYNKKR